MEAGAIATAGKWIIAVIAAWYIIPVILIVSLVAGIFGVALGIALIQKIRGK